jgi:hypothetical protein
MSFQSLRRIIPTAIQKAGIGERVQAARVLQEVPLALTRVWGPEKAALITPISFQMGTVKVRASSPLVGQALEMSVVSFMNEMNRGLGARVVHRVLVIKG